MAVTKNSNKSIISFEEWKSLSSRGTRGWITKVGLLGCLKIVKIIFLFDCKTILQFDSSHDSFQKKNMNLRASKLKYFRRKKILRIFLAFLKVIF